MKLLKIMLFGLALISLCTVSLGYYFLYTPAVQPLPLSGQLSDYRLDHRDIERSYSVYKPASLKGEAAIIFVLHGSMGSGRQMRSMTGNEFDYLADQHNMIVIYPDGYDAHWNDCRRSADYQANRLDIDDVGFLVAILDQFKVAQGISPANVFVTGHSNGGQMA